MFSGIINTECGGLITVLLARIVSTNEEKEKTRFWVKSFVVTSYVDNALQNQSFIVEMCYLK